ncbi:MAG: efflux RND transporter permease subunit [Bacteroidetes bacterium]|nr:efflux RND transporter permease subunit [Bacteroidota bacterium]
MTLTELAIKRPTFIVVIFGALAVLGLFSFTQLKTELLPKMNWPMVTVSTVYPGASPSEVESSVTKLVEDAVIGVDNVSAVRSSSREGVSFVTIEFQQGTNTDAAVQDIQRKVGEAGQLLPDGVKTPAVSKFALDEIPVLRVAATSTMGDREFYQMMKDQIKPRLARVGGVGQVTLIGGTEREIRVNVNADKLNSYGLSILSVAQSLKSSNLDFPTGNVKDQDGQFVVRVAGKLTSVDQMRALVIGKSRTGGDIKLSDVAEVQDGAKDAENFSRFNTKTSIGVLIQKQPDANAVDVARDVRAEFTKIEREYAASHVKFDIAQDGSVFTVDAANAVEHDLMLAIVLVAAVMLLFLHSIRNSVIVMVAIPASMISTFIAMFALGFSLNLMTLLALSLVVGILVDDSIVVLENIYRRLEAGDDNRTAALRGRNEIGFAALAITLVDVVVFLPLALTGGIIGNIMREFAIVVVVSTLMSLFVSFTLTPLLASRFTRLEHLTKKTIMGRFGLWFEERYKNLAQSYANFLRKALKRKWLVYVATIILFFGSISLMVGGFIGFEFMTQTDRGEFSTTLELPPGAKLEETNRITQQVEQLILSMPEVSKTFANVGVSNEGLIGQTSNNVSEINVALVDRDKRTLTTDEVAARIKDQVSEIPGVKIRVNPIGIFGTGNQTPIQYVLLGTDMDSVRVAANKVADVMRRIPGTADVRLSSEDGKPETRIDIDREKLATLGLTLGEVGTALRTALTGDDDAKFREGSNEFTIRIMLDQFDRARTSDVADLTFINHAGVPVQLKQFATVTQTTGPTALGRRDRNASIIVFSQVAGVPSGTLAAQIDKEVAKLKLPAGVTSTYDGDIKNQRESNSSMGLAFLAGILFVYMIMVALYNSYLTPLVVLFSIPVAIIGALLALALTAKSMTIFSMLGFIMLIGLVGKNAILLVDFTNKLREEGHTLVDALVEAGRERLRPILMTTLTMIIGMLPIALSTASGAEWKSGLAWALIGGLSSSLLLTLVLVPSVYMTFDNIKRFVVGIPSRFRNRSRASKKSAQLPEPVVPESARVATER